MNLNTHSDTKQQSLRSSIDITNTKRLEQQKIDDVQSTVNINKSSDVKLNQQFDNQFDEKINIPQKMQQGQNYQGQTVKNEIEGINQKQVKSPRETTFSNRFNREEDINQQANQNITKEKSFLSKQPPNQKNKILSIDKKYQLNVNQTPINPIQMEAKIKQIAQSIRGRVKKQSSLINKDTKNIKNRIKNNGKLNQSLYKLQYRDVVLSPINKPSNQTYQSKLLTFEDSSDQNIDISYIMKDIIKREVIGKVWDVIDLKEKINKNKLKLDPIKHKYPITSFRKVILQQSKNLCSQQQRKLREREQKLLKRRIIYNSSRYERYMKQQKHKRSLDKIKMNLPTQTSIVLLKRQQNTLHSMELAQNPQIANYHQEIIGIFPTQQEGETIQVHLNQKTVAKDEEYQQDYNEQFI